MIDAHRFSHLFFDSQIWQKCPKISIRDFDEVYFFLIYGKLHLMPNNKKNQFRQLADIRYVN